MVGAVGAMVGAVGAMEGAVGTMVGAEVNGAAVVVPEPTPAQHVAAQLARMPAAMHSALPVAVEHTDGGYLSVNPEWGEREGTQEGHV